MTSGGEGPDEIKLDTFWKGQRLTPRHLRVYDVDLGPRRAWTADSTLGITEVSAESLLPTGEDKGRETSASTAHAKSTLPRESLGSLRNEEPHLQWAKEHYGSLRRLRLPDESEDSRRVRWIHVSSKFPDDLQGVFLGLSDWRSNERATLDAFRQVEKSVRTNERFSHHGRFFTPFVQPLCTRSTTATDAEYQPILACFPFLDWTVYPGPTPPLRFQIDDRAKWASAARSNHPFCSLLQHYYYLEDTADRERSQVYTKHKPWNNDRELDIRIKRFYHQHPTGLGVDELWMLVIDRKHIVTFSSNQTWKRRWPQLQLADRIADISFQLLRVSFEDLEQEHLYNAMMHAIVCIHGAVSLSHRGFWTALPLPCVERYAGYFGHLKFRLYRAPSTKLVLDLLQLQDELTIVIQVIKNQIKTILKLESLFQPLSEITASPIKRQSMSKGADSPYSPVDASPGTSAPVADIIDKLRRDMDDLTELRTNTSELVNRTVQLVNLRQEDHGQAILVFTLVTVIFLPLSFLSSFFGMNVSDIRGMQNTQWVFWSAAVVLTASVVGMSCALAFYGSRLMEWFVIWRESNWFNMDVRARLRRRPPTPTTGSTSPQQGFTVLDASRVEPSFKPSW